MSKGCGKPTMVDWGLFAAAGIDPRTGKPSRGPIPLQLKSSIVTQLRIVDEQDAVNRYTWYGLPNNLSSHELERLLYYKGQLAFFYWEDVDDFFFMPFALASADLPLDMYGRYRYIHPIPVSEGATNEEKKHQTKLRSILSMMNLKVEYGQHLSELTYEDLTKTAVILRDYTPQFSQTVLPRQSINEQILQLEAEMFPYMRTALKNSTGIEGVRIGNPDEAPNVYEFNKTMEVAALQGDSKIPIAGSIEFQELAGGQTAKSEEFLLAMQSIDNYRLSLFGIDNGGIFLKKAHMLENEQSVNNGIASIPLQDGLEQRQRFCDIVNSIWGLGIWCEISENILGIDRDFDGESTENDPDEPSYEGGAEDVSDE